MSRHTRWTITALTTVLLLLTVILLPPLIAITGLMAASSSTACAPNAITIPVAVTGEWTSPVAGRLSSPYGTRVHPITGIRKLHDGQDIAAAHNTTVVAAGSGVATVSSTAWAGRHMVTIEHGGGVQTVYGHMSAALISTGQHVTAGQPIGRVGSEGLSTGPHLHLTVRIHGHPTNPVPFFAERHITLGSPPGTPGTPGPTTLPATHTIPPSPGALPTSWTTPTPNGHTLTLDSTQLGYAATFAAQGRTMGVPDTGIVIAFMTVFVESGWRNYANRIYPQTLGLQYPDTAIGSDHDSVGLTQARPAAGWGTPTGLMNPATAAAAFYGGPQGPNHGSPPGLLDIPHWQQMAPGAAAQAVQVSAFPHRYAAWQSAAHALLEVVRGAPATDPVACVYATAGSPTAVRVATLNLLGNSHTDRGGKASDWASGPARIPGQLAALQAADVSIAALQEVQRPQHRALTEHDDTWALYPEQPGTAQNVVAWRTTTWTLVQGRTFTIPYFDGHPAQQTLVQLSNTATGRKLWVISVHNPADTPAHPRQSAYRRAALRLERALLHQLQDTGLPVLLMGDFNDVDQPHCTFTPLLASAYGPGRTDPCAAPNSAGIDQIFLLGAGTFTATIKDRSLIARQLTDHPLVSTTLELGQASDTPSTGPADLGVSS